MSHLDDQIVAWLVSRAGGEPEAIGPALALVSSVRAHVIAGRAVPAEDVRVLVEALDAALLCEHCGADTTVDHWRVCGLGPSAIGDGARLRVEEQCVCHGPAHGTHLYRRPRCPAERVRPSWEVLCWCLGYAPMPHLHRPPGSAGGGYCPAAPLPGGRRRRT